ncbi:MAG: hypothetical protein ACK5L5_08895 [Bacteroidales bacterium]
MIAGIFGELYLDSTDGIEKIAPRKLLSQAIPDEYTDLIDILQTPEKDVLKTFCRLKQYYEELAKKYGY